MQVILIIGFSQSLILAGLILMKKQRKLHDYFLSGLFLIYGLTLFLGYMEIYNRAQGYPYPFFINTSSPFILLHGPALWFYIRSLTVQNFWFKTKYSLHFVPFVFILILMTLGVYSLPAEERILKETTEAFKDDFGFPLTMGMIAVSTQTYFIWGIILIGNYRKRIKNYFSEISEMDLKWLRVLLTCCVIFYGCISAFYIADYFFGFVSYDFLQSAGYAFAALLVLVLAYFGHRQGNIFQSHPVNMDLNVVDEHKNEETPLDDSESVFIRELLSHMDTEKPHLNPELTLGRLARQLRVSPDYLSNILNNRLNKNFFDFINYYRVEEFKQLCRKNKHHNITIMGLAWDAGFNSKATFNRVFKKTTGKTPGEFLSNKKSG